MSLSVVVKDAGSAKSFQTNTLKAMEIKPRVATRAPLWRRPWLRVTIGLAVVAAVWALLASTRIVQARNLSVDGLSRLEGLRSELDLETLDDGRLASQLTEAGEGFSAANDRIRSSLVAPLRLIPWARTQVRSADALSRSAHELTTTLAAEARRAAELAAAVDTMDRHEVAAEILSLTRRADAAFAAVELGPENGLVASLDGARARFAREVTEARAQLTDLENAAAGLAEFLEGPTSYLLLAANNSEMQAGSGSYLMAGVVRISDGALEIDELQATSEILLPAGSVAIADRDLAARWAWLDIASDWRNLSPSPRFGANAALAADMWKELTGEHVDGVLAIDPLGLQAVLSATGPVEIDGRSITADGVVQELLFDQYWEDDVEVRRDRLREIGIATLRAVDNSDLDLIGLVDLLRTAAAGRHVLAWSDKPVQQRAWETVGVDGSIDGDSLMVSVINRGANKLDTFLTVDAGLEITNTGDERTVRVGVFLENRAGADFPAYVLGPAQALGNEPGTYTGILTVSVPAAARDVAISAGDIVALGPDGASQVIAALVDVQPGGRVQRDITFTLPAGESRLTIEPSSRVPGIKWQVFGRLWIDRQPVTVDLAREELAGAVLAEGTARISFEPERRSTPVAPLPFARLGDPDTTVVVSWPGVGDDDVVVELWERTAGGEWRKITTTSASQQVSLADRDRETEYCYRTALATAPSTFGPIECVEIPVSLGFMRFPGTAADYFSAPDFMSSGELDIRALVDPDEWQPDFWQMFAGQYDSLANDRAWRFGIDVFAALVGNFSGDGVEDLGGNQLIPSTFAAGRPRWVRMTIDPDGGSLRFWTSDTGATWAELGSGQPFEPLDGLHDSSGRVFVGTDRRQSENPFAGKLYYLEIRDGIDGPVIADLDFRTTAQQDGGPDRWVDGRGNVFSASGSGWEYVPPDD